MSVIFSSITLYEPECIKYDTESLMYQIWPSKNFFLSKSLINCSYVRLYMVKTYKWILWRMNALQHLQCQTLHAQFYMY